VHDARNQYRYNVSRSQNQKAQVQVSQKSKRKDSTETAKSEDGVLPAAKTKLETIAHLLPKKMVTLYTVFYLSWLIATFTIPNILGRTNNQEAYNESLTISVCSEK
jgi:hypothetical protein